MMRTYLSLLMCMILVAVGGMAREIRLPAEGSIAGNVLIAEAFEERRGHEMVPIEFQAWPGRNGTRTADWFTTAVLVQRGDVVIIEPGHYQAEIWIFSRGITVMTDPESEELAVIHGTVSVDADRVVLERIAVTNSDDSHDSGHGIEVNGDAVRYITIRGCDSSNNRWTGIHMIGNPGDIRVMTVEDCVLTTNGMDGLDAKHIDRLIISGCTITDNGWDMSNAVGIRIGKSVDEVILENNILENNRSADITGLDE